MLVLPIVNKRRVMNVQIKLKNAAKIRRGVCYDDARESDIIVNREKFSESSFGSSRDANAPVDFIRSRSLLHPRSFLVTTKEEDASSLYDVYEVGEPPSKVNDNLDKLYSKAITDMRKEIPGKEQRGRYVSFADLGFDEMLSDDKIAMLQRVIRESNGTADLGKKLAEAGIADLSDAINFFHNFECTLLSDTAISEDSLQDTIAALAVINSRDYRNLKKYYSMAKSNADIYTKISYINKVLYDEPLTLTRSTSKQKQFVKKMDESEFKRVA